ncbi:DUF4312 family protein [Helcococcus sueciensis]|uniref:DUF4312 family protein n=1 Tax=Helcococcus sueciensis TaxID=241555 RepID=UPI0004120FE4|nr:DUF4312 family protein [Helcococcus sueciensis]
MNKEVLVKENIELECLGTADNINKAVEEAFKDMRKKIMEKIPYPIITISTENVFLVDKKVNKTEEAFLYFFSKRIREEISLKLRVKINISYLKI